ncbi:MAG: copper-translocating P-type ATPase [Verrucomicrobiaceae bacterium]|nr:copper-translocating P-type ATPase [Verrucomicrobiaceae bacterium]
MADDFPSSRHGNASPDVRGSSDGGQRVTAKYICPMCPGVSADKPGACPVCGMALERNPAWKGAANDGDEEEAAEFRDLMRRFWVGAVLCVPLLILSMGMGIALVQSIPAGWSGCLQLLLCTPVVFWCGLPLLQRGWRSFLTVRLNMFSLILPGVLAAWGYSLGVLMFPEQVPHEFRHGGGLYFESAAVITVLVLLGQVLEARARKATGTALKSLMALAPPTVWRVVNGEDQEVPLGRVLVGDLLRIKPASRLPVDGVVVEGSSFVDESMLTGEPMPAGKSKGSPVTGGTLNGDGAFIMKAERVGEDTVLSRIVDTVAKAQRSRAPVQRQADHVAEWLVPVVIFIAFWTFLLWWEFGPQPSLAYGIINAVAVLIIACPCALGLATPMALTVGIGRGAQLGILIKDAAALERLESVDTLMLDKTGTLTQGKPSLSLMHPLPGYNAKELLGYAAALENSSEHPLAKAIVQAAKDRQLRLPAVTQFVSVPGSGVAGLVDGREVAVGQSSLMEMAHVTVPPDLQQKVERLQGHGNTVVFIAVEGHLCGLFAIADKLKDTTAEAVKGLHALGLHLVMTTGDNAVTAGQVAQELGVDEVHASLKPDEKLYQVYQARDAGRLVAVAGDGVNDAPALAAAHVGIAMGTGTDVAMQSADITLIKGDLRGIQHAIALSRATMKIIRQNLWFAFIYNGLGIPIAAGVLYPLFGWLLNPMIASAAMSLSSISVILNSLRLRGFRVK